MGAIEPARQVGSTDTKLDQQLDHDDFAVGILKCGYFEIDPTRQNLEQSPRPAETQWIILISGLVAL